MKNIFFILFCIACITYGYGSIQNYEFIRQIGLYATTPCLLIHYLINTKRIELFYLLALLFTFFGDTSFHLNPDGVAREALTIGAFIFVSSFFTLIILERKKFSEIRKTIFISLALAVLFLIINYTLFKESKQIIFATAIYFTSLSILCATSISFYVKAKTKESLYFLIGAIGIFLASIAKSYEYLEKTSLSIILNIIFYIISNLFFLKGVLSKYKTLKSQV